MDVKLSGGGRVWMEGVRRGKEVKRGFTRQIMRPQRRQSLTISLAQVPDFQ